MPNFGGSAFGFRVRPVRNSKTPTPETRKNRNDSTPRTATIPIVVRTVIPAQSRINGGTTTSWAFWNRERPIQKRLGGSSGEIGVDWGS